MADSAADRRDCACFDHEIGDLYRILQNKAAAADNQVERHKLIDDGDPNAPVAH